MDTNTRLDQMRVTDNISREKPANDCAAMDTKNNLHPVLDNGGALLCPITPFSNKESLNATSPLTLASSPPISLSHNSRMNETSSTPIKDVFDPFAPGPDKLMLAPIRMNNLEKTGNHVARRLNFTSLIAPKEGADECRFNTELEEDTLLETVYDSILETVFCKQAEEISDLDSQPNNVFMTPPSAPRLTGIADTCPASPLKPLRKSRNINLTTICRKLQF